MLQTRFGLLSTSCYSSRIFLAFSLIFLRFCQSRFLTRLSWAIGAANWIKERHLELAHKKTKCALLTIKKSWVY